MFIPFFSSASSKKLSRRKGGGGHGHGAGKGSAKGSGVGGAINISGASKPASMYGFGGGPVMHYPYTPGHPQFQGRPIGGGNRTAVYGTRTYGSGYPGLTGRGVSGRGFPYYFWPIVWVSGLTLLASSVTYVYVEEYGLPGAMDRPGGALINAAFMSSKTHTIYRVITDKTTSTALSQEIVSKCSGLIAAHDATQVGNNSDLSAAQPEQAIQYYRASSVVLTLDGYNNSAVFSSEGTPDSQLPDNIDVALLDCLNKTIGLAAPLVNGNMNTPVAHHTLWLVFFGLMLIRVSL